MLKETMDIHVLYNTCRNELKACQCDFPPGSCDLHAYQFVCDGYAGFEFVVDLYVVGQQSQLKVTLHISAERMQNKWHTDLQYANSRLLYYVVIYDSGV